MILARAAISRGLPRESGCVRSISVGVGGAATVTVVCEVRSMIRLRGQVASRRYPYDFEIPDIWYIT